VETKGEEKGDCKGGCGGKEGGGGPAEALLRKERLQDEVGKAKPLVLHTKPSSMPLLLADALVGGLGAGVWALCPGWHGGSPMSWSPGESWSLVYA
jgi:hypothetical protein